jgi:hypothetical protein
MSDQTASAFKFGDRFKVGDRVRIPAPGGGLTGRVVELRGPLGPNGAQIYRIRFRGKPNPAYVEVREDQLELMPANGPAGSNGR